MIHRGAGARDPEHRGLQFHDVHPVHRGLRSQPPGRASRTEADDQRPLRMRMQRGPDETRHHLCAGVTPGGAVGLAIHDESELIPVVERHAALAAVGIPHETAAETIHPRTRLVR